MAPDSARADQRPPSHSHETRWASVWPYSPVALLWLGFAVVHLLLGALALYGYGVPMGDVTLVYSPWAQQTLGGGPIIGIDEPWVYPILALVPILVPAFFGFGFYDLSWLGMIVIVNAWAFATLIGHDAVGPARRAARWWLLFLVLVGPIAVSRIDSVTVPLVIVALLWLGSRPRVAWVLLTCATWVKVWPAAVIAALLVTLTRRWQVLVTAVVASAAIVVVPLGLGAGWNLLSFVGKQGARGLQVEAPISTVWLWGAVFGQSGSRIYYDKILLTWQVVGPGVQTAEVVMTWLMAVSVAAILLLGVFAIRRSAAPVELLPPLVLALVACLIAFNKVGSPQFVTWLAAPVILGLVTSGRAFRTPAILVGVIAVLTQLVYPYLYGYLLSLAPPMVAALTVRNLLYFVVIGWAVARVIGLIRTARCPLPPARAG